MDSVGIPGSSRTQHRILDFLAAVPKLLADKLFWANASGDEEIHLGSKLRVITGSKYRQYCRTKYGPNYLDIFAQKYLSDSSTDGGRFHFLAGPTALRLYRNLLGISDSVEDNEPAPYEEAEGVTTVPLPPLAPVLFAFLVWRAGKHSVKFFETWREKLKRQSHSASAEESRQGQDPNRRGILEFIYDRMMGFMDSEFDPTSHTTGSGLSALELPFLVAFPNIPSDSCIEPQDELQGDNVPPPLHATNPDSFQNSTPRNQRNRSLAIALNLSTPDSVGLRSVIVGTPNPDFSPSTGSSLTVEDVLSDLARDPPTSAIMNGVILNPDTFREPEIDIHHTPKGSTGASRQRGLGDVEGSRHMDSLFSLLLRPPSFHHSEALGSPEQGYLEPDINSASSSNTPVHREDVCSTFSESIYFQDSEVLLLLLEDGTALHEYDEKLLDTLNSTPAATAGSPPWARELDETDSLRQHVPNTSIFLNPSHIRPSPKFSSRRHAISEDKPLHRVGSHSVGTESRGVISKVHDFAESGPQPLEGSARVRKPSHSRNSCPPPASRPYGGPQHSITSRHSHSRNQEGLREIGVSPTSAFATAEFDCSSQQINHKPGNSPLPLDQLALPHRRYRSGSHVHSDVLPEAPAMASLPRGNKSGGSEVPGASTSLNPLRPRMSSLPSASQHHTTSRGHSRTHSVGYTQPKSLVPTESQSRSIETEKHHSESKPETPSHSHRRKMSGRSGPPLTQYSRSHVYKERSFETRRPDSPHPLHLPSRHGEPTHPRHSRRQHTHPEINITKQPIHDSLSSRRPPELTHPRLVLISSQSHPHQHQPEASQPQPQPRYQSRSGSHALLPSGDTRSRSDRERLVGLSHI